MRAGLSSLPGERPPLAASAAAGPLASALYEGTLRHVRLAPRRHAFGYPLFMCMLDLDELDRVFAGRWLWSTRRPAVARFRRADYLRPVDLPLREAVAQALEEAGVRPPTGPVRLLTQLRTFGWSFNPVSFYYCYGGDGGTLEAVVAEVTNTPWRERHRYVLKGPFTEGGRVLCHTFNKAFHVSPFMPMEQRYQWWVAPPGPALTVRMENHQGGRRVFLAQLELERRTITGPALARALWRYPWMSARVSAWIYLQALILRLKGVPFHVHPARRAEAR